ncbi:MAG: type 3 dihydrofolate reductase [Candidatus Thioglobus sp.]|jgi:dihydrofolate reductase|nr:type 3 dihydrofolate reductase [Candidatus Pseudothioglobus aerophilus]MBT3439762.1 type 3 dihydrofolate reductase [Gammaproteobacteria bacterium]MDP0560328.1 type 3 dihydrofolate reductase [Candidatus Thioglobus sp.]MBT4244681.1 type 3 dihydrofolate reductase [Gammaproteobacteria bacterium]MBT4586994.1 type 3 dihydrofolate reductase [Gammaproteobacteria bacterium]
MSLSIVVAMDENRLIGKDNKLPWHLPADLAYFKKNTTGKSIVMGRKTYDSIGRPLPNRRNIVISRNSKTLITGCEVLSSIDEMLSITKDEDEVMIIGGASLCEQLLPQVSRLYITKIEGKFDGDVYFPEYNEADWRQVSCESHLPDDLNEHAHHFLVLERQS